MQTLFAILRAKDPQGAKRSRRSRDRSDSGARRGLTPARGRPRVFTYTTGAVVAPSDRSSTPHRRTKSGGRVALISKPDRSVRSSSREGGESEAPVSDGDDIDNKGEQGCGIVGASARQSTRLFVRLRER